jgi:hypothetical protein
MSGQFIGSDFIAPHLALLWVLHGPMQETDKSGHDLNERVSER